MPSHDTIFWYSKTGKHHFNPADVAGPDPGGAETEEARLPGTVWTMDAEEVEERVGRSGCKVDLAVRHPEYKDCYRIGIVCDGDSYHAATTARDRDRLRTQILRGMGWSLYHVWSRAWLQDPERQKNLLLAAVNSAIESFVRPVECVPVEALIEEATIELEDDAGGTEAEPTAKGVASDTYIQS